jgi:hypothetical protein
MTTRRGPTTPKSASRRDLLQGDQAMDLRLVTIVAGSTIAGGGPIGASRPDLTRTRPRGATPVRRKSTEEAERPHARRVAVLARDGSGVDVLTDDRQKGGRQVKHSGAGMLTGEQVYGVANIYNTGVALGSAGCFAAASYWNDMNIAIGQVRDFWPGGRVATGSLGAAITYDGKPLPPFAWKGVP